VHIKLLGDNIRMMLSFSASIYVYHVHAGLGIFLCEYVLRGIELVLISTLIAFIYIQNMEAYVFPRLVTLHDMTCRPRDLRRPTQTQSALTLRDMACRLLS
jgi:hypothetical protein